MRDRDREDLAKKEKYEINVKMHKKRQWKITNEKIIFNFTSYNICSDS